MGLPEIAPGAVALEAERALIAAAMVDDEVLDLAALPPEAFYREEHAAMWRAMLELRAQGKPLDVVSIVLQSGVPADVVREVMGDEPPFALAAPHYAEAVRQAWHLRQVDQALVRALSALRSGKEDPLGVLANLGQVAQHLMEEGPGHPVTLEEASLALASRLVEIVPGQEPSVGVALGRQGEAHLMDVAPGELHLVAAATGVGKSAIALQVALALAYRWPVLIYTMEMSADEYAGRLLVQLGLVSPRQLRMGGVAATLPERVEGALAEMRKQGRQPVYIRDGAMSQESLLLDIRRQVRMHGVRVVVIDYLGLVELPAQALKEKRYRALENIANALKRLAVELQIAIVALHQLNRLAESGGKEDAGLHMWGDSYGMVRPADGAYLLIRKRGEEQAKWKREKVRNGQVGEVSLRFNPSLLRFEAV